MKIKKKKQINLIQLIEYIQENIDVTRNKIFKTKDESEESRGYVYLNNSEDGIRLIGDIKFTHIFEVEEEVEIDEYTVIPKLLVKWNYDGTAKEYRNSKINEFVPGYAEAMYIVNDDLTMTLIWRDGKLV